MNVLFENSKSSQRYSEIKKAIFWSRGERQRSKLAKVDRPESGQSAFGVKTTHLQDSPLFVILDHPFPHQPILGSNFDFGPFEERDR